MINSREERRADLQNRLIDAAEGLIAEKGLRGLKAREVTARAGCAVGALYNVFDDLDMLIVHVNSRTLLRLGAETAAALPKDAAPAETFRIMAAAYVAFAKSNRRLWTALFDHRLPDEDVEWPEWHLRNHSTLIEQIMPPLAALRPDLPKKALLLRASTLFSAVHGVVQLSMGKSVVGVPRDLLESEVDALVEIIARGSLSRPED